MSAFGGKSDIAEISEMSANDPKRTLGLVIADRSPTPMPFVHQVEGNILQIISWVRMEEGMLDRSRFVSVDCEPSYLRFSAVLKIDTELTHRPPEKSLGSGEACTAIGTALVNAVYDATGVRLRTVPFTSV